MNALNTLVRPTPSDTREHRDPGEESFTGNAERTEEAPTSGRTAPRVRDADGMAVASFVMGLAGLLVFNFVLGPCAVVLSGLALMRGTTRRFRAVLGLSLGVADLIVLAAVTAADGSASWSIAG
ncbi:DUF4190 domain-containing protein [Streptomyces albidus (ex Kaewkla and Franco 2022)]|uniref:DUF4190 domain-containing protein n=1 Tax=Streptomyces albidus (ex Kaewkla and Franco 2022) TaxID=722709 RepID=UPI0015EFD01C|nr:DUF4190 domain-containing protein [Streptomyces albidus (ex Kaewkla and Franco 2022)]